MVLVVHQSQTNPTDLCVTLGNVHFIQVVLLRPCTFLHLVTVGGYSIVSLSFLRLSFRFTSAWWPSWGGYNSGIVFIWIVFNSTLVLLWTLRFESGAVNTQGFVWNVLRASYNFSFSQSPEFCAVNQQTVSITFCSPALHCQSLVWPVCLFFVYLFFFLPVGHLSHACLSVRVRTWSPFDTLSHCS